MNAIFFFSSRRRHTRFKCDWSSDVCSSDLQAQQDRLARTFWLPVNSPAPPIGQVVIITAGTSDLPVAQEAVVTAQALGCGTDLLADVGVAGIHRPLPPPRQFSRADAIFLVWGLGGALPTLVPRPVHCPAIS